VKNANNPVEKLSWKKWRNLGRMFGNKQIIHQFKTKKLVHPP